ncbi:MAG: tRNA 2-thiouridine(34) synthase MnmA [Planctomycetota bacterium]|nr:MAG: tRNA 2-thiouridine(34) synthase MnmA [Planctomycetota bacterium]
MSIQFDPKERLVVAMSGGVDSSVAAWMLHDAGHPLVGLFMRNGVKVDEAEVHKKSCCTLGDARDARMIAARLEIPFQAVDLATEFEDIIEYFVAEYGRGRTPNPCAVCNRDLKMGRLLEFADELGCAGVATGHYARIAIEDGRVRLRRGVDPKKDQSYQLFSVSEAHLARTALPLGELEKPAVRALARRVGLRTSEKKDSQEVCFIPSNDYRQLLAERKAVLHPGAILDTTGKRVGTHEGTEHFTIGQRRGHGVVTGTPMFVVELFPDEGVVVVGAKAECHAVSMQVSDLNWVGFDVPTSGEVRCEVQYRYHCVPAPATVTVRGDAAQVVFDEPQMAVAPGQGAAFYRGELLLGGGWIDSAVRQGVQPEERAHRLAPR